MGRSALEEQLARLSRAEYVDIVEELRDRLKLTYYGYVEPPRSLPDKTSFGDVDLIVSEPRDTLNLRRDLCSKKDLVNGDTLSFEYKGNQIDLLRAAASAIELTRFGRDFCDIGMIVGMLVRGLGLKFGQNGLMVVIGAHKLELSSSLPHILRLLDLDIEIWRAGFQTEEEAFAFVTSSKYFDPRFFERESLGVEGYDAWNSHTRRRMKHRPMFSRFVDFASLQPCTIDRIVKRVVREEALRTFSKSEEAKAIEAHAEQMRRINTISPAP